MSYREAQTYPYCLPIALLVTYVGLMPMQTAAQDAQPAPAEATELAPIEVIGSTPLPQLGVPADRVPANAQHVTGDAAANSTAADVSGLLERRLNSVSLTSGQANPFQSDLNFRGFTASPLLGTPQGLSVYLDGVRVNEAFGDVVNWDLIPEAVIQRIDLIPGSNPMFGLNTLGGAISISTRSGFDSPGTSAQISGGSFGRRSLQAQQGATNGNLGYFVSADTLDEDGYRKHTPSRLRQLFARTDYRQGADKLSLSFTGADNSLYGTQALPESLYDHPRDAYTWPDYTDNHLAFVNLNGTHLIDADKLLSANLYYRVLRSSAFDSNINDDFDPLAAIDEDNTPGQNELARTNTHGYGSTWQFTWLRPWVGHDNQLVLGASADLGDTDFAQFKQAAVFIQDHKDAGIADFAQDTDLGAKNRYYGLYAMDVFSLTPLWDLTLSGRFNHAHVKLDDHAGDALDGQHDFHRLNPAVGLTYHPSRAFTGYVNYSQGTRTPTPVELTCADPKAPCTLPNNFLADPPLKQVVAHSWEIGSRGLLGSNWGWKATLFRSDLDDDILFVSSGAGNTAAGYFRNVPKTRRQGAELSLEGNQGPWRWQAQYSFTDATFQAPFRERSEHNSSANALGDIAVQRGDRVPAIPPHLFKLLAEYRVGNRYHVSAELRAAAGQYARGDENNDDRHDKLPGYAVLDLGMRRHLRRAWEVFANLDNVFDKQYANFATLGENVFTGPGGSFSATNARAELFRTPAEPRALWVGLRYRTQATAQETD